MAHALPHNDPDSNSDDFFNHLLCNEVMEDEPPPRTEEEVTSIGGCLKRLRVHDCPLLTKKSEETETNAEASTSGQSSAAKECHSDSDTTKTEIEGNRSNTTMLDFACHDCGIDWEAYNFTPQDPERTREQPLLPEDDVEYNDENVDRNVSITVYYSFDQFYRDMVRRNGWTN